MNGIRIPWGAPCAVAGLIAFGAAPAIAAGKPPFEAPAGCGVFATVQTQNCQVLQLYRCEGDAAGDQWMTNLDGQGPYYSARIDSETRWMESIALETGEVDRIGKVAADPASFTALLETGRDDWDFTTESSTGEVRRYEGFDLLTGESVTIDGVALERTRYESTTYAADGSVIETSKGGQFIHREWRRFFSDTERFENSFGDKTDVRDTPMEFAFPGDEGFLSQDPKYDCEVVTASIGGAP
jgi:hypothetical protein